MSLVLPDTSIWVEYLRRGGEGAAASLDDRLDRGEVVVCGPVTAELLAGATAGDRPRLWRVLAGLPWSDLDREAWHEVGVVSSDLRARGQTVPLTDVEIAVAAARAGAAVWTADSDFTRVAEVLDQLTVIEHRSR